MIKINEHMTYYLQEYASRIFRYKEFKLSISVYYMPYVAWLIVCNSFDHVGYLKAVEMCISNWFGRLYSQLESVGGTVELFGWAVMLSVPAAGHIVVLQEEETSSDSETAAAAVVAAAIWADRPEIENVYKTYNNAS